MLRNGLEAWHLIIVLAVIVLLFGSKKLPEAARGIGKSLRILKAETRALHEDAPVDTTNVTAPATTACPPDTTVPAIPPPHPETPPASHAAPMNTRHSNTP
ncbi:Sec-independent protein translocase subunit TatA [Kitasatospora sp. NPDC058406]|uniref:Sec-independent protein translocase subunit TatA n=1 Tax=Kitasatospora sp. NPDC058406 TaxID=3346483 RepID=UPI00364772CB